MRWRICSPGSLAQFLDRLDDAVHLVGIEMIDIGIVVHKGHKVNVLSQPQTLFMEVDNSVRGHEALCYHNGVAFLLQQFVKTGPGAVFHGVAKANQSLVLRQTAVRHRLPVGGDALTGGGEPGQAADDSDALVAPFPQGGIHCGK